MADKIKPCPFCGEAPVHQPEFFNVVACANDKCDSLESIPFKTWNNRPQEKRLKDAIDVLMKAMCISMDEGFTHKMRSRRLNQALEDARKILKIDKVKKAINN